MVIKGNGDLRVMSVGECGFMPDAKMVTCTNARLGQGFEIFLPGFQKQKKNYPL